MKNKPKNQNPLVSVIMPVYNAGSFLMEAIESILNQTYQNFEFIIVDDGSTDNSWKIITYYQKKHPNKIKVIKLKKQKNYAGNGAVNYALKQAKGEFIVRMDADDISHPKRLEKQIKFMVKNPKVIVLGTQAKVIDKKGKIIGKKKVPISHKKIYEEFGIFNPVIHPSCMFRRSLLPCKNKIYEEKYNVNSDYYTFFKLLNFGKFANLPFYLIKYRIHGNNSSLKKPKEKFINSLKIRFDAIKNLNYKISLKSIFLIICQVIVIFLIPEKFLASLYMIIKGIKNKQKQKKLTFNIFLKETKNKYLFIGE